MKFVFIFLMTLNSVFAQATYSTYLTARDVRWCDLPQVTRGEVTYEDHTVVINYQKSSVDASIIRLKLRTQNQFSYDCEPHYNNLLNEIATYGGAMSVLVLENEYVENGCEITELESEILGIKYYGRIGGCSDSN